MCIFFRTVVVKLFYLRLSKGQAKILRHTIVHIYVKQSLQITIE